MLGKFATTKSLQVPHISGRIACHFSILDLRQFSSPSSSSSSSSSGRPDFPADSSGANFSQRPHPPLHLVGHFPTSYSASTVPAHGRPKAIASSNDHLPQLPVILDVSNATRIQTPTAMSEINGRRVTALLSLANRMLILEQQRHFSSQKSSSGPSDSTDRPPSTHDPEIVRRRRIHVPNYGPDAEKAVRSLQNARKERARAKTAANVRRAMIGNFVICVAKLGAWLSSGSSSMMSEFIHSVVDCGNQSLLLMGLRDSRNAADRLHPYGYGKAVYFWALVSALGTFFLGAGVSMSHSIAELMNPSLHEISSEVWAVLALSFVVDGYVLNKTIVEIQEEKPAGVPFWKHAMNLRDPATLAVLLEDGAACLGIVMAIAGITASHATGMPIFDGLAGVGISCLLGGMGMALVRVNHRFLLGQGVSREMTEEIERIIRSRTSIDGVYGIQSQWTGPETFSFKAEIDFDGTYLAAELMPRYQGEFHKARDQELQVLLSWYAEDVIRAVEREVRHIEALIRQRYPGAEFIELEPMSKDADRFAIDDSFEEKLLLIEKEEMQRLIRVLHQNAEAKHPSKSQEAKPLKPSTTGQAEDKSEK